MDPAPVFNDLLGWMQILILGLILAQTYFSVLAAREKFLRQKYRTKYKSRPSRKTTNPIVVSSLMEDQE